MAGIYVHIPFCKVKCNYCDFHFSTRLNLINEMMRVISEELEIRAGFLKGEIITTIYFGGGTPSIIPVTELSKLVNTIRRKYNCSDRVEMTMECNPDDITPESLLMWRNMGVNRLSIGIQSFDDDVLHHMNRAHNSAQAHESVSLAKSAGYENITVDLIYGIPGKDFDYWKRQLDEFLALEVQHLSAYCLTIEPKTYYGTISKRGLFKLPDDDLIVSQFELLVSTLESSGYEQYEISNFAKPGFISQHNSAYWLGVNYLGVGPSAHSYNGVQRSWNIANNSEYLRLMNQSSTAQIIEDLTESEKTNDYLLTRLRTNWGIKICEMKLNSDQIIRMRNRISYYVKLGLMEETSNGFRLTRSGKFRADGIAADLFV